MEWAHRKTWTPSQISLNESKDIFKHWNIRIKGKEQPYFGSWELEQVFIDSQLENAES